MHHLSNLPGLADLPDLALSEIAALPAEELLRLQEEAGAAVESARRLKDRLDGAIAQRYAERARLARVAAGKDTGTVRLEDGAVVVIADLPKKVSWDQDALARMAARIRDANDNPADFMEIAYRVPERKFTAWPPALRDGFAAARTVETGKPTFRLEPAKGA